MPQTVQKYNSQALSPAAWLTTINSQRVSEKQNLEQSACSPMKQDILLLADIEFELSLACSGVESESQYQSWYE